MDRKVVDDFCAVEPPALADLNLTHSKNSFSQLNQLIAKSTLL